MTCAYSLEDGGRCTLPVWDRERCLLHHEAGEGDEAEYLELLRAWPWTRRPLQGVRLPFAWLCDSEVFALARDRVLLQDCLVASLTIEARTRLCAARLEFVGCRFEDVMLRNSRFSSDVRFIDCSVSGNLEAEAAYFQRLVVADCRVDNLRLQLEGARDVEIARSWTGDLAVAADGKVERLRLRQTSGRGLLLANLLVEDLAAFGGLEIEGPAGAGFTGGTFEEADFSGMETGRLLLRYCSLGSANLAKLEVRQRFEIAGNAGAAAGAAEPPRNTFATASFEGARLAGEVYWHGTRRDAIFASEAPTEGGIDASSLRGATFAGPARLHSLAFDRCRLYGCNLESVELVGVRFPRCEGRAAVYDELAASDDGVSLSVSELRAIYRSLQRTFESHNDYDAAGEFRIAYWDVKRLRGDDGSRRGWAYRSLSLVALYNWVSGYGERWQRALGWAVALILVAAGLYLASGFCFVPATGGDVRTVRYHLALDRGGAANLLSRRFHADLWSAVQHSFFTFCLRRENDFGPTSVVGEVTFLAQQILSPVLVAMLVLGIRRRFEK